MKKLLSIALVFVFIATMSIGVYAAPAPKVATVSLSASELTVNVNEPVALTAATLKQGSSFTDSWTGAEKVATVLNTATGYYASTSTFKASTAGEYTITYDIAMNAGKSGVTFIGSNSITITVIDPATIVGATVKNLVFTPKIEELGKDKIPTIVGYDGTGEIYALWSDGKLTDTGAIADFHYGRGEKATKTITVTFIVNGIEYIFDTDVVNNLI